MNRFIIIMLLIFTCVTVSFGQKLDESCKEAIQRANTDFSNGKMEAISYGLLIVADWDFEDFYDKYLLDIYGIKTSNGGCVIIESENCYSTRMFELIRMKYGKDIFNRARKEAEKLYPKEIKDFEDDSPEDELLANYVIVDVQPEFPGGLDSLFKYVDNQRSKIKFPQAHAEGKSFVSFVIDSTGRPIKVEIIKGYNAKFDSTIVEILTEMPSWKPGTNKNKKVNVKMVLPFSY